MNVYRDTLENGLRLVTVELPHLHSASVAAYVRVGSRFEEPRDNGLSHFLEHMLFRGTRRLPDAYQLNYAVEELGGTLYAETRRDCSLYQIGVHPEVLRPAMGLLGEILLEPAFSNIDTERRILLEELREDIDERGGDANLTDLVYERLFPEHPLGRKITGPMHNVERFDEADLWRHFASFYGAQNLILCTAGAVHHAEVMGVAADAFRALPRGRQSVVVPPPPAQGPRHVHGEGDGGSQVTMTVAFRAPGCLDPDDTALAVLSRILDDGMSTRLYQRVAHELGLAYSVSGGVDSLGDVSVYDVESTAVQASIPRLLREILGLLTKLREESVTAAEMEKVRRRYRWDLLAAKDGPLAMSNWYGPVELYNPAPSPQECLARVEAVRAEDVQRVARRVFVPEGLVVGTLGHLSARLRREVREIIDAWAAKVAR